MASEGISFKTNCNIGVDLEPNELLNVYDSVLLAVGSTWPRDLPIPGIYPLI